MECGFYVLSCYFSWYFRRHGLKAQVLLLSNGMIGSIFICSLWHNDNGAQNLSGLSEYLHQIWNESVENMSVICTFSHGSVNGVAELSNVNGNDIYVFALSFLLDNTHIHHIYYVTF